MDTIDQVAIQSEARQTEEDGSAPVIAVEDLHKSFGSQKVLNGVSLSVKPRRDPGGAGAQRHRKERIAEAHHRPGEA